LKYLDLACGRIRTDLTCGWRSKRDDRSVPGRATSSRSRFEPAAVVPIAVQNFLTLGGVHASGIGLNGPAL